MMNVGSFIKGKGPYLRRSISGLSLVDGNIDSLNSDCPRGSPYTTNGQEKKSKKMLKRVFHYTNGSCWLRVSG